MMRSFFLLALLIAVATAFSPPVVVARHGVVTTTQRSMFDGDNKDATPAASLEVVADGESAAADAPVDDWKAPTMVIKNLSKGGEVKEVNFYDPDMAANTGFPVMEWWAYGLVGTPFILLANDFLHFLPTEGPLAFLQNY